MVSVEAKGGGELRQVRIEETNASEPLMKRRNGEEMSSKPWEGGTCGTSSRATRNNICAIHTGSQSQSEQSHAADNTKLAAASEDDVKFGRGGSTNSPDSQRLGAILRPL